MKQFKDTSGRDWSVVVDIRQIKAVRDLVKVDLFDLFNDEAKKLFSDPIALVDTLYVLCKRQCEERKMSDLDFGQAFNGETLEAAANALLEEVVSFFPPSRQRMLRATIERSKLLAVTAEAKILEQIEKLDVTDLLKSIASPASSESTPVPSRFANCP